MAQVYNFSYTCIVWVFRVLSSAFKDWTQIKLHSVHIWSPCRIYYTKLQRTNYCSSFLSIHITDKYPSACAHLIPNSPEHSGKWWWSLSPWHSHQGQTSLPSHPMISGLLFFYGVFAIVSLWNVSALSTVWLPMKAVIVIFLVEQHSRQWKVQIV